MKIIITIETEENAKVEVVETQNEEQKTDNCISDYARFFDEVCSGWSKDPEYNLMFLRSQEQYANDLLRAKGHLFLNEVYDMLGIPRTKAGQVVGWCVKSPFYDGYVDFGINDERNSDFVNGNTNVALLDFNVVGNILDMI